MMVVGSNMHVADWMQGESLVGQFYGPGEERLVNWYAADRNPPF